MHLRLDICMTRAKTYTLVEGHHDAPPQQGTRISGWKEPWRFRQQRKRKFGRQDRQTNPWSRIHFVPFQTGRRVTHRLTCCGNFQRVPRVWFSGSGVLSTEDDRGPPLPNSLPVFFYAAQASPSNRDIRRRRLPATVVARGKKVPAAQCREIHCGLRDQATRSSDIINIIIFGAYCIEHYYPDRIDGIGSNI